MAGGSHNKPASLLEETLWMVAAALAARTFCVPLGEVMDTRGRTPGRPARPPAAVGQARRAAIYLAATGGDLTCRALQRATGQQQSSLRAHLRAVEDDRELRAELDQLLDDLTALLQTAMARYAQPELLLARAPAVRLLEAAE